METEEREMLESVLSKLENIKFDKWVLRYEHEGIGGAYTGSERFETKINAGEDMYEAVLKRRRFFSPKVDWDDCDSSWSEDAFSLYSTKDNETVFNVSEKECVKIGETLSRLYKTREDIMQKEHEEFIKKRHAEEEKYEKEHRKKHADFLEKHMSRLEKAFGED